MNLHPKKRPLCQRAIELPALTGMMAYKSSKLPRKIFPRKVKVDPKYQMSTAQIKKFYEDGFIGPLDAFSREEMADFRKDLLAEETTKSETYGFVTPRDRHFEMPRLWNYMKHPAITERLAQLLGPDLNVWRTQIFYKPPKSPAIPA